MAGQGDKEIRDVLRRWGFKYYPSMKVWIRKGCSAREAEQIAADLMKYAHVELEHDYAELEREG